MQAVTGIKRVIYILCRLNLSEARDFLCYGHSHFESLNILYLIGFSFSEELQAAVRLLAPKCDIKFLVSEDGSGKGAAMVTAVAQRLALQSRLLEDSDGEENGEDE
ncbi:hypothetical protein ATANTOWER_027952 [Ataeniobius toweri]|uniref:Phosphotransferase n=1 Tax=Ataeniobius toweri TaxID=208326 RepID=A0ABU7A927_9TELE|nr:hypothetical protein [Ataeniobius toweri]